MKYSRYPEYKDSGIEWVGEIPEHWNLVYLRRILTIQKGKAFQTYDYENQESDLYLPYLTMEYLRGGEPTIWVSKNNSSLIVTEDETLLLWDGSNAGEFLKSKKGVLSSTIAHIGSNKVDRSFLFYIGKSLENILKSLTVGMGIPHVDGEILKSFYIPVPTKQEQRSIAVFLNDVTSKIDRILIRQRELIELLKEKRQAIITHAVTKGLDPNVPMKDSGVEWIGEIPEHWKLLKLKYAAKLITEKSNEDVRQVALENIESWSGRYIATDTEYEGEGVGFIKGDVLFGKLRPYLAKVYRAEFSGSTVGEFFVLRPTRIESEFLTNWLLNSDFINVVDSSTYGAKMPRVAWSFMGDLQLVVPPMKEQEEITVEIEHATYNIDFLISKQQKMIELLKEHKNSLISNAVTGKIDVRGIMQEVNGPAGQTS